MLSLGRSRIPANYTMFMLQCVTVLQCYSGNILKIESSNLEKDLGIIIDNGLNFTEHRHMVSNKANINGSYQKNLHMS